MTVPGASAFPPTARWTCAWRAAGKTSKVREKLTNACLFLSFFCLQAKSENTEKNTTRSPVSPFLPAGEGAGQVKSVPTEQGGGGHRGVGGDGGPLSAFDVVNFADEMDIREMVWRYGDEKRVSCSPATFSSQSLTVSTSVCCSSTEFSTNVQEKVKGTPFLGCVAGAAVATLCSWAVSHLSSTEAALIGLLRHCSSSVRPSLFIEWMCS